MAVNKTRPRLFWRTRWEFVGERKQAHLLEFPTVTVKLSVSVIHDYCLHKRKLE